MRLACLQGEVMAAKHPTAAQAPGVTVAAPLGLETATLTAQDASGSPRMLSSAFLADVCRPSTISGRRFIPVDASLAAGPDTAARSAEVVAFPLLRWLAPADGSPTRHGTAEGTANNSVKPPNMKQTEALAADLCRCCLTAWPMAPLATSKTGLQRRSTHYQPLQLEKSAIPETGVPAGFWPVRRRSSNGTGRVRAQATAGARISASCSKAPIAFL